MEIYSRKKQIFLINFGCSIIGSINITFLLILSTLLSHQTIEDTLPLLLLTLSCPVLNIFKAQKKYIYNKLYLMLYFIINLYILFHSVRSLLFLFQSYQQVSGFVIHNYFWKPMIYIIVFMILLNSLGHFSKSAITINWKKHNTFFLIEIIIMNLCSVFLINPFDMTQNIFKLAIIAIIIMILKPNVFQMNCHTSKYLLLIILSLIVHDSLLLVIALCNINVKIDK